MKLKVFYKFVYVLLVLILCVVFIFTFQPLSQELKYDNQRANKIAEKLINHCLITKKDVKVYVGHSVLMDTYSLAYATPFTDTVYVSHRLLKHKYLDVILAHELGHIEYNTGNQDKADLFAAKLVGRERVIEYYSNETLPFQTLYHKFISVMNIPIYTRKDGAKMCLIEFV